MLIRIVIILFSSYVGICVLIWLFQNRMIFFPSSPWDATPADVGLDYQELMLDASGKQISAWLMLHERPRARVIFFHGNAGNISHRLDMLYILHQLACEVLIVDYQGYGRSQGKPSEAATYQDAQACWDFMQTRAEQDEKDPNARRLPLVIFGKSLGGAVAVDLASKRKSDGLIVESSFSSVPDMGARLYPWLPVRLLSRTRYHSVGKIPKVDAPKLFLHSPQDEIVPYALGRKLFEAAKEPKQWVNLSGGHNDGFLVSKGTYLDGLNRFLDALTQPSSKKEELPLPK